MEPVGSFSKAKWAFFLVGTSLILVVLIWQALSAHGAPDPNNKGLSRSAMVLSSGILVFREGLEAILVLAAVTAGLARYKKGFWTPVLAGIGVALLSTVATWFIAIALISSVNASELAIQAGTGLLAIIVLLVVMNWFFHKLYWTGWICHHCKRRKQIFEEPDATPSKVFLGLALLGFTAIYREGFEVVLFLQDLRLKAGSGVVLSGAGIGLFLTSIVAALTFAAHRRLPYKKMLIYTGGLLAGVLTVMVGESAQEMQLAGWIPTHHVNIPIPDWMGVWFATFPNVEGLTAQFVAVTLVLGSYLWVRSQVPKSPGGDKAVAGCEVN
ncbi:MAG: FTR1 family protein [Armatimonadetes bacterium]|nr:FTR1 family protein [Armatimonadota bacterium]